MPEVRIHVFDRKSMPALVAGPTQGAREMRDRLILKRLKASNKTNSHDIVADLNGKDRKERAKHVIGLRLLDHHQHADPAFDESVVFVSVRKQESIVWISDRPFRITRIEKDHHAKEQSRYSPPNPFYRRFPEDAIKARDGWYRLGSGPARLSARGQHYKITLRIGRKLVDPDFVCSD